MAWSEKITYGIFKGCHHQTHLLSVQKKFYCCLVVEKIDGSLSNWRLVLIELSQLGQTKIKVFFMVLQIDMEMQQIKKKLKVNADPLATFW